MTLTKKNITKHISNTTNLSIKESQLFFESFLKVIKEKSITNNIKINKFGSFYYKLTPKRYGRNPKTGTMHVIKPFNRFIFKTSNNIKNLLN